MALMTISIQPIGVIRTPYQEPRDMPIQGKFDPTVQGRAEVFPEYAQGLKDIEGFSHLILMYYFHKVADEKLIARPFLEDDYHGIFAIRAPVRPNRIGFSIVKLEAVEEGRVIVFSEVDMLDNTPLLDIKPYVSYFDSRDGVRNGWVEKHFDSGQIPQRARLE